MSTPSVSAPNLDTLQIKASDAIGKIIEGNDLEVSQFTRYLNQLYALLSKERSVGSLDLLQQQVQSLRNSCFDQINLTTATRENFYTTYWRLHNGDKLKNQILITTDPEKLKALKEQYQKIKIDFKALPISQNVEKQVSTMRNRVNALDHISVKIANTIQDLKIIISHAENQKDIPDLILESAAPSPLSTIEERIYSITPMGRTASQPLPQPSPHSKTPTSEPLKFTSHIFGKDPINVPTEKKV
jgi:hypothetical protein